ncbi:protein of unknown function (plasmid) [Streptantibioticus cattleyicolor NRRL 8057 = DSM 46488]|nr:protein of unknown function [Streptantibioticus cattleyicolor NRRL 8057 = DSM 46488]
MPGHGHGPAGRPGRGCRCPGCGGPVAERAWWCGPLPSPLRHRYRPPGTRGPVPGARMGHGTNGVRVAGSRRGDMVSFPVGAVGAHRAGTVRGRARDVGRATPGPR